MCARVSAINCLLWAFAVITAGPAWAQGSAPAEMRRQTVQLPDAAIASIPAHRRDIAALPPLIVLLHGAGQSATQMIDRFARDAACADAVLVAPKSIGPTWDVIAFARRRTVEGGTALNAQLSYAMSKDGERVMDAMAVLGKTVKTDPKRQVLLGFSDGATFALALGTGRDRPFTAVVALSPGLAIVNARPARARPVLIMHGKGDRSLPFETTRATIVPALRGARLAVRFIPFEGGHEIVGSPVAMLGQEFPDLHLPVAP